MERFTFFENGQWCIRLNGTVYAGFPEVDRLAAYEDTGLEPEEVLTAKEMAEVACDLDLLKEYQFVGSVDRYREFVQAEKDGRLVVQDIFTLLPIDCDICEKNVDGRGCKELEDAIDDSSPEAEWHFILKICPKEVCHARATPERLQAAREGTEIDGIRYFLTKQEADAALKKREEADDGKQV